MASPFALYASNFLKRGDAQEQLDASRASSQPLFYSATAGDDGSDDGDPFRRGDETPGARSVVGDDSLPHLAGSFEEPLSNDPAVLFDARQDSPSLEEEEDGLASSRRTVADSHDGLPMNHNDDNDEDEEDDVFPGDLDALPMMDSEMYDSTPNRVRKGLSASQSALNSALLDRRTLLPHHAKKNAAMNQSRQGWRSHQAPGPSRTRSPPSSSRSPLYGQPYLDEEEDGYDDDPNVPPAYLTAESLGPSPPPPGGAAAPLHIPPTRAAMSVQLNESLLPRDGVSRTLFYLPDPDRPVGRNKYHDPEWMTAWLTALSLCAIGSVLIFFVTDSTPKPKGSEPSDSQEPTPYSTLTHTIPLLTSLTLASAGVSYGYLILFRFAVRPMLVLTAISTPLFLFLTSAYAFSGSFFSETGNSSTWGETIGLRLFSIIPLGFAYLSAKSFYKRYESLVQTASVVELSTSLLIQHPSILLLSVTILLACFIASIPFLSLALRLLLFGYFSHPPKEAHVWVWHVRNWAGTLAFLVLVVWLWSWAIARGTMRVVVSGVIGHWYFTSHDPAYTIMSQQQATRAAFARASGPSLGSIAAGSLTIATVQSALYTLRWARRFTTPLQLRAFAPLHPLAFVGRWIAPLDSISTYALVYIGITGDGFWNSAKRARGLVQNHGAPVGPRAINDDDGEDEDEEDEVPVSRRRRRAQAQPRRPSDYTMVASLLSLSALSLAVFSAVGGYVFAAHSLSGPTNAPLAALTCGIVTFLTVKFGLGLGEDAADAVYVCYHIDVQAGTRHRAEVFEVLEGKPVTGPISV